MRYIKIEGNLIDVLGEDARLSEKDTGLRFSPQYQFLDDNVISLGIITNEIKAQKYFNYLGITVLNTVAEFNHEIDKAFIPKYAITSESLMNANLNQKITNNAINLDEMQPDWTLQQETEWLYNKGISGIKKSEKPPYLVE